MNKYKVRVVFYPNDSTPYRVESWNRSLEYPEWEWENNWKTEEEAVKVAEKLFNNRNTKPTVLREWK